MVKKEKFVRVHFNPILASNLHYLILFSKCSSEERGQTGIDPLELVEAKSIA